MPAFILGYAALAAIGVGLGLITYQLGKNPPTERPEFGMRGLKRAEALDEGGVFALAEPAIRLIAGWVEGLELKAIKGTFAKLVRHSGEWRGLSGSEAIAMSLLSGVVGGVVGLITVYVVDFDTIFVVLAAAFGFAIPYMNLQSAAEDRFKTINRTLPGAIDLAALCMGAGLDFPGALRQIAEKSSTAAAPLVEEVNRILQELDLGHTRRKALESFAERVPTEAVRDFVGTVVQAEAKGTPLAEVLTIQAQMLRMRRSVLAEEAAAKAGLMMMGPLMIMFVVVILLLMGPFVIRLQAGGF